MVTMAILDHLVEMSAAALIECDIEPGRVESLHDLDHTWNGSLYRACRFRLHISSSSINWRMLSSSIGSQATISLVNRLCTAWRSFGDSAAVLNGDEKWTGLDWTLYFDPIEDAPRRARNLVYALSRPDEVDWRVTLSGRIKMAQRE